MTIFFVACSERPTALQKANLISSMSVVHIRMGVFLSTKSCIFGVSPTVTSEPFSDSFSVSC